MVLWGRRYYGLTYNINSENSQTQCSFRMHACKCHNFHIETHNTCKNEPVLFFVKVTAKWEKYQLSGESEMWLEKHNKLVTLTSIISACLAHSIYTTWLVSIPLTNNDVAWDHLCTSPLNNNIADLLANILSHGIVATEKRTTKSGILFEVDYNHTRICIPTLVVTPSLSVRSVDSY